jgi:hypothetical protein
MRKVTLLAAVAFAITAAAAGPVEARGCLKGAVVGGIAGHLAHHGVLGAVGGCVVGHHMAAKQQREYDQQQGMQRY